MNPPCVIFEDDHLLVVNKPAGINTHAPAPHAGEGIYDWLRHREPRWAGLAIIHRLDKETSGVIAFSKTSLASRSLTDQFTRHAVQKKYVLLTDRPVRRGEFTISSTLVRAGQKYISRPVHTGGERAETRFRTVSSSPGLTTVEAEPVTGKTHQIRVHAAASGFPILGDQEYGGTPANRVCLHAGQLILQHPATGKDVKFDVPADFAVDARLALRSALIDSHQTNAYRLIHGASDGWPGWYLDRLDDFLLSQSEHTLSEAQSKMLADVMKSASLRGAYHKLPTRQTRTTGLSQASPQKSVGEDVPDKFVVRENGVHYLLSFREGYSVGLFLDQRDNRRRFLTGHVAAGFPLKRREDADLPPTPPGGEDETRTSGIPLPFREGAGVDSETAPPSRPLMGLEVLNTFAYTCGFSVCAAVAGGRTTNLDLSKKYLEWGKQNFVLNNLDPADHDFIYGDAFGWMRRLAKKQRKFDVIVLDPPTFSQSTEHGAFKAENGYGELVASALPLLKPGGVLFASTNAAKLAPEKFLAQATAAIRSTRRSIAQQHYFPQPVDFPISRGEPPYLKTVWLRIR